MMQPSTNRDMKCWVLKIMLDTRSAGQFLIAPRQLMLSAARRRLWRRHKYQHQKQHKYQHQNKLSGQTSSVSVTNNKFHALNQWFLNLSAHWAPTKVYNFLQTVA